MPVTRNGTPPCQRVRISYAKNGALRYTGTLDVHKLWERALRRAGLPLAYSQGFHPQPRLNQASPLPLGMTGRQEVIDIWFEDPVPLMEISRRLVPALPEGLEVHSVSEVDLGAPALQSQLTAADYLVTLLDPDTELEEKVRSFLAAPSLVRQRRGKSYDLRPLVEAMECLPAQPGACTQLSLRLALRSGASGRPEELLLAMGIDPVAARIERTALIGP